MPGGRGCHCRGQGARGCVGAQRCSQMTATGGPLGPGWQGQDWGLCRAAAAPLSMATMAVPCRPSENLLLGSRMQCRCGQARISCAGCGFHPKCPSQSLAQPGEALPVHWVLWIVGDEQDVPLGDGVAPWVAWGHLGSSCHESQWAWLPADLFPSLGMMVPSPAARCSVAVRTLWVRGRCARGRLGSPQFSQLPVPAAQKACAVPRCAGLLFRPDS